MRALSEPNSTVDLRNPLSRVATGTDIVLADGRRGYVAGPAPLAGKLVFVQRGERTNKVTEIWAGELRDHRVVLPDRLSWRAPEEE
jgi:hypothetical protein